LHPRWSPGRSRAIRNAVARSILLAGLLGLTCWQGTRSAALTQARDAEGRGDFATALRCALEHLDRRPWGRDADRVAARCLSRLDFAEKAEPYYRRARALTIEDLHYRAYGLMRANLRDRAIAAYQEILRRRPADVTALRTEAGILLSQTRWNDVRAVARRLIEIPPGPVTVYTPIAVAGHWTLRPTQVASAPVIGYTLEGIASHDLQETEEAVAAFERVLELDPDLRSMPLHRPLFWSHLAEGLLRMGRSGDVIQLLTRMAEARNDPGLLDLLGQAYQQQSSFDEAERCWRHALEWDPNHFGALLNLGRVELQRARPEEAVRLLDRAAGLKPESYEAAYSLGLAYRRMGREDEARRYQEKAARLRHPGTRHQAPGTGEEKKLDGSGVR
jgi:tetratricopeptide (TPR) repeat protein